MVVFRAGQMLLNWVTGKVDLVSRLVNEEAIRLRFSPQ